MFKCHLTLTEVNYHGFFIRTSLSYSRPVPDLWDWDWHLHPEPERAPWSHHGTGKTTEAYGLDPLKSTVWCCEVCTSATTEHIVLSSPGRIPLLMIDWVRVCEYKNAKYYPSKPSGLNHWQTFWEWFIPLCSSIWPRFVSVSRELCLTLTLWRYFQFTLTSLRKITGPFEIKGISNQPDVIDSTMSYPLACRVLIVVIVYPSCFPGSAHGSTSSTTTWCRCLVSDSTCPSIRCSTTTTTTTSTASPPCWACLFIGSCVPTPPPPLSVWPPCHLRDNDVCFTKYWWKALYCVHKLYRYRKDISTEYRRCISIQKIYIYRMQKIHLDTEDVYLQNAEDVSLYRRYISTEYRCISIQKIYIYRMQKIHLDASWYRRCISAECRRYISMQRTYIYRTQ